MSVSSIDLTWFQWRLSNSFILTKALKLQGWDNTMSISSKHLGALDKILTQTHCYQVLSNYYSWKCCVNIMYCVCLVFSVDFVMVCTPHHTHEGIVIAALEAGTTWVHCDIIFKTATVWVHCDIIFCENLAVCASGCKSKRLTLFDWVFVFCQKSCTVSIDVRYHVLDSTKWDTCILMMM